jgi:hypothetical protein
MPPNTPKSGEPKSGEWAMAHPQWDKKRGTPKNPEAKKIMEKAHGSYSASEQSEVQKRKRVKPAGR